MTLIRSVSSHRLFLPTLLLAVAISAGIALASDPVPPVPAAQPPSGVPPVYVQVTGGTAKASSTYNSSNLPAYAFDGSIANQLGWGNNNIMPSWLEYDYPTAKVISRYRIYNSTDQSGGWNSENYNPKAWQFQGSNDGIAWTTLHPVTDGALTIGQWKTFDFTNTFAYTKYRINITAAESGTWTRITELELYAPAGGVPPTPTPTPTSTPIPTPTPTATPTPTPTPSPTPTATPIGPALSVSPATVVHGGSVTASWSGVAAPTTKDWIGVYIPGALNSAFDTTSWRYTSSCTQKAGNKAKASGSCAITMPSKAGSYELRLFANDGFTLITKSPAITVN